LNEIDELSSELFEEARQFLDKARSDTTDAGPKAYMHAALLLGFSSLEAHLNAIAEELASRTGLGVLDLSILTEREYVLEDGTFHMTNRLKIFRLEDRLQFIVAKFSQQVGAPIAQASWFSQLKTGLALRNQLVHPKGKVIVEVAAVAAALTAILDCLDCVYRRLYGRPFPTYKRGLNSTLHF
jgi:hypothetical protein